MSKETLVLCTGGSLVDLTDEEIEYVNSSNTICVNRFPVFWKIIGIKPKKYILVDDHKIEPLAKAIAEENEELEIITTYQNMQLFKKYSSNFSYTLVNAARNRKNFITEFSASKSLFWSSVVGSAVNSATILYPGTDIKILGMDGDTNKQFWQGKTTTHKKLDHSSNKPHSSNTCLKWGLPIIKKESEKLGISTTSCNKESVWVKRGLINFRPLLDN